MDQNPEKDQNPKMDQNRKLDQNPKNGLKSRKIRSENKNGS